MESPELSAVIHRLTTARADRSTDTCDRKYDRMVVSEVVRPDLVPPFPSNTWHKRSFPLPEVFMRKSSLAIAICCFGFTAPAWSQQWTPEQQSVITALETCWDTWMESIRQDDPSMWIDQCTDGSYTYWWTEDGAPNTPATLRRDWERVKRTDLGWVDIRPLAVKIVGAVAIMQFYGYWDAQTPEGPVMTEAMRTEVFRRAGDRWLLVAGHSTPSSSEDADPYRR